MITAEDFRRIALGMDGALEGAHMGHPDFRANGRVFASLQTAERGMVKLTPAQQETFVAGDPQSFIPESGAWGRQGCTRVLFATVDEEALGEAMTLAWRNSATAASPSTPRRPTSRRSDGRRQR